ncbi:TPA: hypothetical protein PPE37_000406 [Escherichia coli]|nr:hypothetical protein [Escherichia coli]
MHSNNNELVSYGHKLAAAIGNVELREVAQVITSLATQLDVTTAAVRAMQAERDQLAAECAALKAFGDKLDAMRNDLSGEGTGIQGRAEVACQQIALEAALEEFDAIKTPATDRFLADQRAQGVDLVRNALIAFVEDEVGPNANVPGLIRGAEVCESIAAQLRNEVKV